MTILMVDYTCTCTLFVRKLIRKNEMHGIHVHMFIGKKQLTIDGVLQQVFNVHNIDF